MVSPNNQSINAEMNMAILKGDSNNNKLNGGKGSDSVFGFGGKGTLKGGGGMIYWMAVWA